MASLPKKRAVEVVKTAVGLAVLVLLLLVTGDRGSYSQQLINVGLVYAVVVIGLGLTLGLTGLIDLSVAGFVGIGAYATAIAATRYGLPVSAGIIFGVSTAVIVALPFGLPTLRLKKVYLALVTLAFSSIMHLVFQNEAQMTGGAPGLSAIPRPHWGAVPLDDAQMQWFLVGTLALAVAVARMVSTSNFGNKLRAIRQDRLAAELVGIPVARMSSAAFLLAAGFYGLGGSLYALQMQFISPDVFALDLTVLMVAALVVGGSRTVSGPIVGAFLVVHLPEWLRVLDQAYLAFYGMMILAVLLLVASGVVPALYRVAYRLFRDSRLVSIVRPSTVLSEVDQEASYESGRRVDVHRKEDTPHDVLLDVQELAINFGGVQALKAVTFDVRKGEIQAIIGPNGAGKTTLINCMTGAYRADTGTVHLRGQALNGLAPHEIVGAGIARTFQNVRLFDQLTVWETLLVGQVTRGVDRRAGLMLEAAHWVECLGLEDILDRLASDLSFGERRRLELCRSLIGSPAVLLLDEPAAGLTSEEIGSLSSVLRRLRAQGFGVLLIEHNMDLVMNLVDRVTVIDVGAVIARGTPVEVQGDPLVIEAYLGKADESQDA